MPVSSKSQWRFMQAIAHDPKFAKKAGVKKEVGQDFIAATPKDAFKKLKEKIGKKK